jgi:hypothetical protein
VGYRSRYWIQDTDTELPWIWGILSYLDISAPHLDTGIYMNLYVLRIYQCLGVRSASYKWAFCFGSGSYSLTSCTVPSMSTKPRILDKCQFIQISMRTILIFAYILERYLVSKLEVVRQCIGVYFQRVLVLCVAAG